MVDLRRSEAVPEDAPTAESRSEPSLTAPVRGNGASEQPTPSAKSPRRRTLRASTRLPLNGVNSVARRLRRLEPNAALPRPIRPPARRRRIGPLAPAAKPSREHTFGKDLLFVYLPLLAVTLLLGHYVVTGTLIPSLTLPFQLRLPGSRTTVAAPTPVPAESTAAAVSGRPEINEVSSRDVVVARVNNDPVDLAAFNRRVAYRTTLWQLATRSEMNLETDQYRELRTRIQQESLGDLITHRLVSQQGQRDPTPPAEDQIQQRIASLTPGAPNDAGAQAQFEKALRDNQLTLPDFRAEIIEDLTFERFLNTTVLKDVPNAERQKRFSDWLDELTGRSKIEALVSFEEPQNPTLIEKAQQAGLAYYRAAHAGEDVTALAVDYGSHVQISILRAGKPVKELGYGARGQIYEIGG